MMDEWFKRSTRWKLKSICEWNWSEREYADYILEGFYTILKFQQAGFSRIKVGVFKDRLFYILNGFSVEMIFTNQVNPTSIERYS